VNIGKTDIGEEIPGDLFFLYPYIIVEIQFDPIRLEKTPFKHRKPHSGSRVYSDVRRDFPSINVSQQ
jgi:hypothetical protein